MSRILKGDPQELILHSFTGEIGQFMILCKEHLTGVIRIAPPLIIGRQEIDRAFVQITKVIPWH